MLVMVVFFIAFRWIHLSTPLIRLFLLVLILLLMTPLNLLPVWFALSLLRFRLPSCFFFKAKDGIGDYKVTGVQTCALPISAGGAAVVLTSEEVARRSRRPVWVLASAAASDWMLLGDKRDLSRVPATERAAAAAYKQAGLTPTDVDVVELHDCFTIAEIVATE